MLYLKYRPQTIDEIDNSSVKEKLLSIISSKEIPHAFLLLGPKGTGKTSTARIIAKSFNCENNKRNAKGESYEPCNKCKMCLAITAGSAIDVIEIDAASNRRIDDIRELNNTVKFMPVSARIKAYIIDEVHMLTTEAFNALLKTLEEPPQNVVFILATTESQKLPKTIVSRCVCVQFTRASKVDLISSLRRVSTGEKITIDDQVLELVASRADFAFRDAHKILEELISAQATTLDKAEKLLGIFFIDNEILSHIEKKDAKKIFEILEDFENKGGSFKTLNEAILNTLHLLLLKNKGINKEGSDSLNFNFTLPQIVLLLKLFQTSYRDLKTTPIEALPIEIAVVEYFTQNG